MPLVYRPAREQDLERAQELVVRSINDLTARHGFGPMAVLRPTQFSIVFFEGRSRWLVGGRDAGEILGFAFSWACGDLWFLAELFVSPGHQGRGIGRELLKRTLQHAQKSGATKRALITFTFNTVSQGLYIRHGMFPLPIYNFKVARELLMDRLKAWRSRSRLPTIELKRIISNWSRLRHEKQRGPRVRERAAEKGP